MSFNKLFSRDTHFEYRTLGIFFFDDNFDMYRPIKLTRHENKYYNICTIILDRNRDSNVRLVFKDYFLK